MPREAPGLLNRDGWIDRWTRRTRDGDKIHYQTRYDASSTLKAAREMNEAQRTAKGMGDARFRFLLDPPMMFAIINKLENEGIFRHDMPDQEYYDNYFDREIKSMYPDLLFDKSVKSRAIVIPMNTGGGAR